jgi:ribonucleoside-triphosphate reductase
MYLTEYFHLKDKYVDKISKLKPEFGYNGFGEIIFYRTYSRIKSDGGQENWNDCVIRVINGTFSIRKDWYLKNRIEWNEEKWQRYAYKMAIAMFKMYWLPPGRGMWVMGTQFIYERGSMALYNCGFTKIKAKSFSNDVAWLMDGLMLGVGVGFEPVRDELNAQNPLGSYLFRIADTRESWVTSIKLLIDAYTIPGSRYPEFCYDDIRPEGLPIKGFGGISSGPAYLKILHGQIKNCFQSYINKLDYDVVRLKTDIANMVGCCVIAGNVRRSAEIAIAPVTDTTFMNLKDYEHFYPERESYGYMSNNAAKLYEDTDYEMLGEVATRVRTRGEPGVANVRNFRYGRIGKRRLARLDRADGLNP